MSDVDAQPCKACIGWDTDTGEEPCLSCRAYTVTKKTNFKPSKKSNYTMKVADIKPSNTLRDMSCKSGKQKGE